MLRKHAPPAFLPPFPHHLVHFIHLSMIEHVVHLEKVLNYQPIEKEPLSSFLFPVLVSFSN
jgi:hypothetical protein